MKAIDCTLQVWRMGAAGPLPDLALRVSSFTADLKAAASYEVAAVMGIRKKQAWLTHCNLMPRPIRRLWSTSFSFPVDMIAMHNAADRLYKVARLPYCSRSTAVQVLKLLPEVSDRAQVSTQALYRQRLALTLRQEHQWTW